MTVALQVCGIVGLVFLALLFLMAFLDAHGWFNKSTRTTSVPYFIQLSHLKTEMNYWGASTLMELREAVSLNLNRTVEFVDDEVRCNSEDEQYDFKVGQASFVQGLNRTIIEEFLKEARR